MDFYAHIRCVRITSSSSSFRRDARLRDKVRRNTKRRRIIPTRDVERALSPRRIWSRSLMNFIVRRASAEIPNTIRDTSQSTVSCRHDDVGGKVWRAVTTPLSIGPGAEFIRSVELSIRHRRAGSVARRRLLFRASCTCWAAWESAETDGRRVPSVATSQPISDSVDSSLCRFSYVSCLSALFAPLLPAQFRRRESFISGTFNSAGLARHHDELFTQLLYNTVAQMEKFRFWHLYV